MDINVLTGDIETMKECFLLEVYFPKDNRWEEFSVNKWENTLDRFMKFVETYKNSHYFVSYNGLSFDSQILEWIIRNYENWHELSNLEICAKISQKAQDVIDNSNYEIFPEYREKDLSFKQIDLFKLSHFDNRNFRVSLKRVAFEMDMENIEEMPVPWYKENLTKEDIELTKSYCRTDVIVTHNFYLHMIGEVEHPLYKGNNQIEQRFAIEEEFEIPCLSFSNAKIGDEIIKKYYCEAKGIDYKNLPRKGFFRKKIDLKYCIPTYISFKTKQLQDFLSKIKKLSLGINEDFEENIEFYGQKYSFMRGGIHNVINGKIYTSDDKYVIKDLDISGFYAGNIINNAFYQYHLGKEILIGFNKVYLKRNELKPLAKKDKKIKGIVSGLKEALVCPYGKSSDMQSWLFDKQFTLAVCISGELSLLMLVESMELKGFKCIMLNTDGGSFIVERDRIEEFRAIKEEWLKNTTKNLTFELEEVDYKKMVFSSVNDYLAIKEDKDALDRVKLKGDMCKDFLLNKNKSNRIVPIALEQYYVNNIPVEQTIRSHTNIYDFCIRQKASKDFHYRGVSEKGVTEYKKLIRYYISIEGETLSKVKNKECLTNAPDISIVEKNEATGRGFKVKVVNFLPKTTKVEECSLNYQYYTDKAQKIIDKIALGGKKPVKKVENQLNLF